MAVRAWRARDSLGVSRADARLRCSFKIKCLSTAGGGYFLGYKFEKFMGERGFSISPTVGMLSVSGWV